MTRNFYEVEEKQWGSVRPSVRQVDTTPSCPVISRRYLCELYVSYPKTDNNRKWRASWGGGGAGARVQASVQLRLVAFGCVWMQAHYGARQSDAPEERRRGRRRAPAPWAVARRGALWSVDAADRLRRRRALGESVDAADLLLLLLLLLCAYV